MSSETTLGQRLHRALLLARIPASILMAGAILLFARPTASSLLLGALVVTLGEALRIWASGHIHKSAEVTRTGPYAICRHPLYLGHLIIATGFCIAADSLLAFVIVIGAFFVMYVPTWKNEERHLTREFGDTYRTFMAETPAILPRWNAGATAGTFDWQLVRQHREWRHLLLLVAGLLLMGVLSWVRGSW